MMDSNMTVELPIVRVFFSKQAIRGKSCYTGNETVS